jgi:hypothetical protein
MQKENVLLNMAMVLFVVIMAFLISIGLGIIVGSLIKLSI